MKILILDDQQCEVELIHYQLQKDYENAEIVATTDPEIALGYADSNIIDIAIIDMCMPGMTGYEIMQVMEEQIKSVVFMSAQPKALEVSNGYAKLEKPYEKHKLMEKIKEGISTAGIYDSLCELERLIIGNKRYNAKYAR